MPSYPLSATEEPRPVAANEVILVASGDERESANVMCWPAQAEMEAGVVAAFEAEGFTVCRGHPYDPARRHGFISSQRMGMDVFMGIHPDAPVVVAEAVWQYSHHVFSGLQNHRGRILTIANWSGQWPGLVGMLNLNACLRKAGIRYSSLWSKDFTEEHLRSGIQQWLREGIVTQDDRHVHDLDLGRIPKPYRELGRTLAQRLIFRKAIMGVFDEGCMGMYNAIVEDHLLNSIGIYKERLSQSALVAAMKVVPDEDARSVRRWLDASGLTFVTGSDEAVDLTDAQIHEQCRMYVAALRMADEFGCDAIGIQYQQGLKDITPASDLVEGLLNNAERPPVLSWEGKELYAGAPLPHFNEVDECAGADAIITNRVLTAIGLDPAVTLHDVRWGEHYTGEGIDDFVWLFQISGAVPASHIEGGYANAISERQSPMYFRLGGGTLKGVCKPGEVIWSRVFVEKNELHVDLGRATAVRLPYEETARRWSLVSREWPLMHLVLHGVTREQFMARHRANHVSVAYAPSSEDADKVLAVKASMFAYLGLEVHLCGI